MNKLPGVLKDNRNFPVNFCMEMDKRKQINLLDKLINLLQLKIGTIFLDQVYNKHVVCA